MIILTWLSKDGYERFQQCSDIEEASKVMLENVIQDEGQINTVKIHFSDSSFKMTDSDNLVPVQ